MRPEPRLEQERRKPKPKPEPQIQPEPETRPEQDWQQRKERVAAVKALGSVQSKDEQSSHARRRYCKKCKEVFIAEVCPENHAIFMYTTRFRTILCHCNSRSRFPIPRGWLQSCGRNRGWS
eukprot:COSAG05_NODE_13328_length_434_cov_0.913433_1_plen_120_part_01